MTKFLKEVLIPFKSGQRSEPVKTTAAVDKTGVLIPFKSGQRSEVEKIIDEKLKERLNPF